MLFWRLVDRICLCLAQLIQAWKASRLSQSATRDSAWLMEQARELPGLYLRLVAIVTLLLGLNDAARLLGVTSGSTSPITVLGVTGFVYLGIFCLSRLFASVGLWIKASWGAVLVIGATGMELALFIIGSANVQMSAIGFAVRVVLLVAILAIVFLGLRARRQAARAHD